MAESEDIPFVVHLRDCNEEMVAAWKEGEAFGDPRFQGRVEVSGKFIVTPDLDYGICS